jgi:PAS domain S-box-containing protein
MTAFRVPAFRDLALRHKLISIIVATSCVSLLLASFAFVAYDKSTFRAKMVRDVSVEADIIAMNSTAALTFEDFDSARTTLSALNKEPSVVSAALESADGEILAEYRRDEGDKPRAPLIQRIGHLFTDERLAVRREIRFDGDILGYVYIESDLKALTARVNRFLVMVVTIIAGALLVVIFASSKLQRLISDPIMRLAKTANRISREKDYTLRATKRGEDEVGVLIDGFNEMLAQIEQRDAMLESHKEELESEVAARTTELRDVNSQLEANQARLRAIVEGTASKTGADFFDALTRSLSSALGMRWVIVGRLRNDDVQAIAMWDGQEVQHDVTYALAGTPCADAVENEYCVVEENVLARYPADVLLQEMGAQSYVGYVLRDKDGRPIGILNAVHDAPLPEIANDRGMLRVFASRAAAELERIEVEAELQRSETSTRAILESAADGIITISSDGVVETINPAAEQIFGRDPESVVGRSVSMLMQFPGEGFLAEDVTESPEVLVGKFIGARGEIEGIRADGSVFPMNIAAGEMKLGNQIRYTAIVRDVTREHELDQMKADFISTVSHEIRTPLACIMSSAKILKRSGNSKPEVMPKFSNIIIDEGKRLTRLINDLLDLSKMDSNSVEWSFADEGIATLVDPIMNAFSAQAAVSHSRARSPLILRLSTWIATRRFRYLRTWSATLSSLLIPVVVCWCVQSGWRIRPALCNSASAIAV